MQQMNLFECLYETYKIKKPIRLIELFGGIGAQAKSLEILNSEGVLPKGFEHYRLCEFDKYAIQSYNAVHHTNFEVSDITKLKAEDLGIVDRDQYEYIMCYSFPCTDLSLAGKQEGMKKGSGTRSGLLWEVERLLNELGSDLPQILVMENVPQVVGEGNKEDFKAWVRFLESKGYSNYYDILNAVDFGIPQNRERCFMVSILGDYYYEFPKGWKLELRLRDMLQDCVSSKYAASDSKVKYLEKKIDQGWKKEITTDIDGIATCVCNPARNQINDTYVHCYEVDEKYYLSDKMKEYIKADNEKWTGNNGASLINKTIASTINTGEGSRRCDASNYICSDIEEDNIDLKIVGSLKGAGLPWDKMYEQCCKVYSAEGVSPTLDTMSGGNRQPKVLVLGGLGEKKSNSGTQWYQQDRIYKDDVALCVNAESSFHPYYAVGEEGWKKLRIRKLTPLECWRLMAFSDEDFFNAKGVGVSDSQLYKQAGNSIVVSCLVEIFRKLL